MQEQPTTATGKDATVDKETAILLAVEAILFAFGGLLLISGIVLAGSTASTVQRVPGYGLGLCLIDLSAVTLVGASALHFHRRRIEDKHAENEVSAEIREELKKINGKIQALARIEEKRSDQLASRRNGLG